MNDSLQQLISRSRSPGDFVERRRFTLSREKAIEKQRAFALRDPRRYILELVQSAVHAQASFIAVDVHYEHVLIAFVGGRCVGVGELSQLFDYLFADRGDPETRHLIQLAMGVNALLKLKPHSIRIESGLDEHAARMDIDHRGTVRVGEPQEPIAGTYVFARLRSSFFKRFSDIKVFPEQALIEERCNHTPVPILINGAAPFGYRVGRSVDVFPGAHQLTFDTEERYGVVALPPSPGHAPGFKVVMGGTWITTLQLPELGEVRMRSPQGGWVRQPFFGVICDDTLRKTADQSDIVRDRRFSEMIRALRPIARSLARRSGTDADYLGAEDDDAAALPVRIPVLGQPEPLPARSVKDLPADAPLFWVSPDETAGIAAVADPAAFEARVLVLREAEAADLAQLRPELPLQRLSRAAEVDYARHLLQRAQRLHAVEVAQEGGARLTLRLHLSGPRPGWGTGEGAPALIERGGEALVTGRLLPELPGVSVALSLPPSATEPSLAELGERAQQQAWRLLSEAPDGPATSALAAALLQRFGKRRRADQRLLLPPYWGQEALRRLLSLPVTRAGLPLEVALQEAPEGPWRPPFEALPQGIEQVALPIDLDALEGLQREGEEAPGWLCAMPVQTEDLRGWLGLRDALPPSPGVLLWEGGALSSLTELSALPVQGVLHGARTPAAVAELRLAVLELYARLLPQLEEGAPPSARAQAQAYLAASAPQDALAQSFERALGRRPAPAAPHLSTPLELAQGIADALIAALQRLDLSGVRLYASLTQPEGLSRLLPGPPIRSMLSDRRELTLVFTETHPAFQAALEDTLAQRRLLLEASRVLAEAAPEVEMFPVEHSALVVALLADALTPAPPPKTPKGARSGAQVRGNKLSEPPLKPRNGPAYASMKSRPD